MIEKVVLTVKDVNGYIKRLLDNDELLSNISVEGEISNYKRATSGHLYFSLKDNSGKISCVMFRSDTFALSFEPKDGMKVIIEGNVSVFEKNGNYQFYVRGMKKQGVGKLYEEYTRLLKLLEAKGYFDNSLKKDIPDNVKKVAVVTSKTGAAVQDIISVIQRRNKNIQIIICPTLVQGVGSAESIAKMINLVNKLNLADVIITGRGGGSIEELWAFNELIVAQAIFDSKIPVVSSVGHETDFTICDFVSDFRAPTPSVAGEIVSAPLEQIEKNINNFESKINNKLKSLIREYKLRLEKITEKSVMKKPEAYIENMEMYVDTLNDNINLIYKNKIRFLSEKLDSTDKLIRSLSFESVLNRGYAIVKDKDNNVISEIKGLSLDKEVTIQLKDGSFVSEVKNIEGK